MDMFTSRRMSRIRKNAMPVCPSDLVNGIWADRGVERA